MTKTFRVSGQAAIHTLAGAIAHVLRADEDVILRAIGANAVNNSVKAIIVARNYVKDDNIQIVVIPQMSNTEIAGDERTVVELTVRQQ